MKFLGMEVPQEVVAAMEARMRAHAFRDTDLALICRGMAPGESREFHLCVASKLIRKHRRSGAICANHGEWNWVGLHDPGRRTPDSGAF